MYQEATAINHPPSQTEAPAKTARRLKITSAELEALLWVRDELASGRIKHEPTDRKQLCKLALGAPSAFNMSFFRCGTAACVGGWMKHKLGDDVVFSAPFMNLFYPLSWPTGSLEDIQPKHAVRAIDSFLKNGYPKWHLVSD